MTAALKKSGSLPLVVLVEDDEAVLQAVTFSLELDGFRVLPFGNGRSILDALPLPAPACLVVDFGLPDGTGLELIAALRARGLAPPAIIIAASARDDVTRAARRASIAVLHKPLLGAVLVDAIRAAMAA